MTVDLDRLEELAGRENPDAWLDRLYKLVLSALSPGDILPATDSRPECVVVPVEPTLEMAAAATQAMWDTPKDCDPSAYVIYAAVLQSLRKDSE